MRRKQQQIPNVTMVERHLILGRGTGVYFKYLPTLSRCHSPIILDQLNMTATKPAGARPLNLISNGHPREEEPEGMANGASSLQPTDPTGSDRSTRPFHAVIALDSNKEKQIKKSQSVSHHHCKTYPFRGLTFRRPWRLTHPFFIWMTAK